MSGPHRTLPIRVPPQPGEALDSWLEALAARLQCPIGDLGPVLGLAPIREADPLHRGRRPPNWTVALHDREAHALADACELEPGDIHALTLMRYHQRAVVVRPESRRVHRDVLWGRANGSRFCPHCLAESGGRWRLSWRLGWSFACTTHQVLLADTCRQCLRLQRLHVTPAGTLPTPGRCVNPGGSIGRSASRSRCGADLTTAPVLALPDGHPVLRTQDLILDAVHNGVVDFGLYAHTPVADFLSDVRVLSKVILTHPDPDELAQHIPADIADAFAGARALPHSKSSPSASPVRPGFAAPARAEITAAVATIPTQALVRDDMDQAGTALAWLFAPRSGQRAVTSGYRASALVLGVRRAAALHHVTSSFVRTVPGRTGRARSLPGLLWPSWTVALAPPKRHFRQTFQGLAHGLSVLLALVGSADSVHQASSRLGACEPPDRIAELLHQIHAHPSWPHIDTALKDLADYLDHGVCPIDYQRRRQLDYSELLPDTQWHELSRRALHFPGDSKRPLTVRRWLFERISCLPADQAPAIFALTSPQQRSDVSALSRLLTPELLGELDDYARAFLRRQGASTEPVTWSPPTTRLSGLDLPGTLLSQCPTGEIHRLLRDEHLVPRTIASRLGTSVDAVRCILNEQPAPLNTNQQRANGRLVWKLADQLSADDLRHLHQDEKLSVAALARRFDVPEGAITSLLEIYGMPRTRHSRGITIDQQWLHREYVTNRRPFPGLATEIGVSTSYLRRQAKAMGIPIRPKGGTSQTQARLFGPEQKKIAQDMLATGEYSMREVAYRLGFTTTTIRRHTSKNDRRNVPKRKRYGRVNEDTEATALTATSK